MKKTKGSKLKILKPEAENDLAIYNDAENFLIVGIGASAGGIQALKTFFENVRADSGLAYVVILHLSPDHDSQLAEVLQVVASIPVAQVTERVRVEPNRVYVVPPNQHLEMSDGHIVVSAIRTIEERRAPVDIFFRTLAESHGERAVAVILSGTGANGSMGIKRIKEKGGIAFVQNPREAEFSEMPRHSIATDLIDLILNVSEIPAQITAYRNNPGKIEISVESEKQPKENPPENPPEQALLNIFTQLRVRTGHDFTNYKRATILRRIERRINVHQLPDIIAYAAYLRDNPDETHALLKDLLISVTNFFRDKETFLYLENEILPKLFGGKNSDEAIRVWVAGCATGEEAYSLAMFLAEQATGAANPPAIQIFATDIDETAVLKAREGFYSLNDAADVSPERLKRFFTEEKDGYRIRRELREVILFAHHNVIKDPPFSRLDLVTCRNMLIYLNHPAQQRVMETFHFSLNAGGYLFLGNSETVDGAGNLYAPVSREHHIYQSRQAVPRIGYPVPEALSQAIRFVEPTESEHAPENGRQQDARPLKRISFGDLHQQLLEEYTPSVVVSEEHDIVHMSESSLRFFQMTGGEPTQNLLKLVRPELRIELRTALYQAAQRRKNVEVPNVKIKIDGREESVNICVRPVMRQGDAARGFILVLFESVKQVAGQSETVYSSDEPVARQLEEELIRSKEQLRSSSEQYEVQAEELKASNEELQAMNEELRSSSEELETGKEELQSLNEELGTVNQELKIKIEEISQTSNNLNNLINSTDIGTIFLDRLFRVDLFTPAAAAIFNLIPADIGRPLADIANQLEKTDLHADAKLVLETLQAVEREVRTVDGRDFGLRVMPYRTEDDKIGGVVLTFYDVTARLRAQEALRESEEKYRTLFDSIDEGFCLIEVLFDGQGKPFDYRFLEMNPVFEQQSGLENARGKTILELVPDLEPQWVETYGQVARTGEACRFEADVHGMNRVFDIYAFPANAPDTVAVLFSDITDRKKTETDLRESETRLRLAVEAGALGTWEWDLKTDEVIWNDRHFRLLGLQPQPSPLKAEVFFKHIHPDDRDSVSELLQKAVRDKAIFDTDFRAILESGETRWMSGYGRVTEETADGVPLKMSGVMFDINDRKQAEQALRESKERLRLLIESAADYAIFTMTPGGEIDSWSAGAEKIFGWTEEEAIGQSGAIIFTTEDREKGAHEQETGTSLTMGRAPDERFHVRRDGSRFYASGVLTLLRDANGDVQGFVKIARDMTESIEAEKALRDKELLQKLVGAQETERKRIARDLHDELGQQLTALRLKLDAAKKLCEGDELCGKVDEIELLAKSIDHGIDFLAWELRPAALDDLGLVAALDNYVKQWSHHSGVTAELLASSLKRTRFTPEIETNLYRIVQEALNNTHKHARAKSVEVVLERRDNLIVLLIEDNGIGFNPKDKKNPLKGIGLIGMKERAQLIGGTMEIESTPKKGTTVYVRVPAATVKRKKTNDE